MLYGISPPLVDSSRGSLSGGGLVMDGSDGSGEFAGSGCSVSMISFTTFSTPRSNS